MKKEEYLGLCWPAKVRVIMADLRVIPRAIVLAYCMAGYEVMTWFMALAEPTNAQGAFVVTFAGILPAVLTLYSKGGNAQTGNKGD